MTIDTSFLSQGYMFGIKSTKLGFLKWANHIPGFIISDYCVVGHQTGIVQADNHLHFSHQLWKTKIKTTQKQNPGEYIQ